MNERENHKKTPAMEFLFKRHRLQLIKKGLLKNHIFFPVKFVKFFRTILSRTTFGECFCFMGWPGPALSKQQVFDLAH